MTIDRDALLEKARDAFNAAWAAEPTVGERSRSGMRAALDAILPEVQRETWDEAIDAARNVVHRRAGQPHETDIDLITLENPYRKAASE